VPRLSRAGADRMPDGAAAPLAGSFEPRLRRRGISRAPSLYLHRRKIPENWYTNPKIFPRPGKTVADCKSPGSRNMRQQEILEIVYQFWPVFGL